MPPGADMGNPLLQANLAQSLGRNLPEMVTSEAALAQQLTNLDLSNLAQQSDLAQHPGVSLLLICGYVSDFLACVIVCLLCLLLLSLAWLHSFTQVGRNSFVCYICCCSRQCGLNLQTCRIVLLSSSLCL